MGFYRRWWSGGSPVVRQDGDIKIKNIQYFIRYLLQLSKLYYMDPALPNSIRRSSKPV